MSLSQKKVLTWGLPYIYNFSIEVLLDDYPVISRSGRIDKGPFAR
jgi:hypothetical protein